MGKKFENIIILALLFPIHASASNLCTESEKLLFSCDIKSKTVSICSSKELTATSGYLKYRYGKPNSTPKLEYPSDKISPKEAFSFAYSSYAKGTSIQLAFNRGEYTYTIDLQTHVYRPDWSGIVVERGGEQVALLRCNKHNDGFELYYQLEKLDLPVNPPRYFGTSTP